ncbi:protein FAR1-RELATED SEQUENCE 5-like [Asparagus officinalis]|uniref:protein FAR1-RELATED SEQUENCE 5-like n=1 Tax=Asparagus officinalis TaxID=4686 RepID=UPI00098E3158|nr:protein FAR1-RELATED SEQUENCE 5-like [Asparagus officinalis]
MSASTSNDRAPEEDTTANVSHSPKESDANPTLESSRNSKEHDANVESNVSHTSKDSEANTSPRANQASEEVEKNNDATNELDTSESADGSHVDPQIGMKFHSQEQAFKFYNSYAKRKGFSVRKGHLSRRKDGSVRDRHFLCSNEGYRREHRTHITKKPRPLERTNCMARIEFKVDRDNTWIVNKFMDDHNHPLACPNKIHMLRSHRNKMPMQRPFITEMDYIGVKPAQVHDSPEEAAKVIENSGFLLKNQSYYLLHSNRTRDLEKGDAQFLLDFLKDKQVEDPSFFYAVQVDEKDRLTNFFWTDARSIFEYSCFGDAVLFDTTYRASRYDIPFAPLIGVNHHRQIVVFGAALLLDESTESFVWLFKTLMTAMSGKQPRTFFTDNCDSLSKAISLALPETNHQLCLWHIIQNAPKIIPHVYGHESSFQKEFENWIHESRSEEDLQKGWETLLTKYNLRGNSWFEDLYSTREKWSSVHRKSSFCATMTTRQWCESMGSQFKMLFYRKLPPSKFMVQYHQALLQIREKELSEDRKSRLCKPTLLAGVPMLTGASESYTRIMYKEFEDEYRNQLACICEPVSMSGTVCTFKVSSPQKRSYGLVEYDPSNISVTCSCKKFEMMGILCMHALKVLNYNNILHLPSCYILKRWTKYAKDGVESNRPQRPDDLHDQKLLALRYTQVCHKALTIAVKSAFSKDAMEVFEKGLDRFMDQMVYELHNDPSNKQASDMNLVHGMQQNTVETANMCFDGF